MTAADFFHKIRGLATDLAALMLLFATTRFLHIYLQVYLPATIRSSHQ
jgi:hypothetical protein